MITRKVIDWRLPEYRMEGFLRYYVWRIVHDDLDQGRWSRALAKGKNIEQRLWISFLFGQTYSTPLTYAFYHFFPDPAKINLDELKTWTDENYTRSKYGTDTKYNKGYFHQITESYFKWLDKIVQNRDQFKAFTSLINNVESERFNNFHILFNIPVKNWYKFGRMCSWLWAQTLNEIVPEIYQEPDTMFIDNGSSWSVWNGMSFIYNDENKYLKSKERDYSPSKDDIKLFLDREKEVYNLIENYEYSKKYNIKPDYFLIESALCQIKKVHQGRDYVGHTSGDFTNRGRIFQELFPDVDWSIYKAAVASLPDITRYKIEWNGDNKYFKETGKFVNLHSIFEDVEIVPSTCKTDELYLEEKYR